MKRYSTYTKIIAETNPHSEKYPVDQAKKALKGLGDLIDEVDNKHAAHFTNNEWKTLANAYDILKEYVYDITH